MNVNRLHRAFSVVSTVLISVLTLSPIAPIVQAGGISNATLPSSVDNISNTLQFTSAGHVLGFSEDGVMIASARHMLKVNFLGSKGSTPQSDVQAGGPLGHVTYTNAWDGVKAVYESSEKSVMKSTYFVDGANVKNIRLGYNRPVQIDEKGNLLVAYEDGIMTESAPIAWQEISGQKKPVQVAYALLATKEIGFKLGEYVKGVPVVIDPTVAWNTFLGGSSNENSRGITTDGSGNVFVIGDSTSTWGTPVNAIYGNGSADIFVAKLGGDGSLAWNTFLGSGGTDNGNSIKVDNSGYVYIAGVSSATWGTPINAHAGGGGDGVIAKIDGSGNLLWNTFFGGSSGTEIANSIALDGSGNIYTVGSATAAWGSPVRAYTASSDIVAVKFNSSGAESWHTFFGGSGFDNAFAVAVDGSGNVYVGGYDDSTWGSPVRAYTAANDASVTKLDSSGAVVWNTFLGGSGNDVAFALVLDASGNIFVGGHAFGTWSTPIRAYDAALDGFVARLDTSGTLVWNTFLGGSGSDGIRGLALDVSGNLIAGGNSNATWGTPLQSYVGGVDAMIVQIDLNGVFAWNTFVGGTGTETPLALALDTSGNAYMTGISNSTWGTPVRAFTSGNDSFAFKLSNLVSANGTGLESLSTTLAQPMYSVDWTTNPSYSNVTYTWSLSRTVMADPGDACLTTNDCFKILLNLKDTGTVADHLDQEWMTGIDPGDVAWGGPLDMSVSGVTRVDTDSNGRYDQLQLLIDCSSGCAMVTSTPYSLSIVNGPLKNPVSPIGYVAGGYTSLTHTMYVNDQSASMSASQSMASIVAIGSGLTVTANVDPTLTFSVAAVPSGTSFIGENTDVTPTDNDTCNFGVLAPGDAQTCMFNLSIATNASNGYSIYVVQDQNMTFNGNEIKQYDSNSAPAVKGHAAATTWVSPATAQLAHLGYSSNDTSVFANSGTPIWAGIPDIAQAGNAPVTDGLVADSVLPGSATYAYAIRVESAATLPQGTNYVHHEYFMVVGNF
ncbi:MAG: hypothetical protein WCK01_05110 [Candidatus Uhrbacteria bacterium]